jgi:ABC-type glycerol-3-phosphate transport system permease component
MDVILGMIVLAAVTVVPLYRIMAKAGLNPILSLIIVIPGLGYLIVIGILAFATWPNEPEGYR